MAKTKYTAEAKAEALATLKANGGNVTLTASLLRIPRKTLDAWSKGNGMSRVPVPDGLIEEKAGELADRLDHIASLLANEMTNPEKIAKASLKDVSIAMGVTIDKRNLLRHQPTSITQRLDGAKQYEALVQKFIADAAKNGMPVDRAEAIDYLKVTIPGIEEFVN